METRVFNSRIQLRSAGNGEMRIGGYAARYNIASKPIASRRGGSFQEVLMPSAFRNVLGDASLDCVCLVNHDPNQILGRTTARTLRLSTDSLGLEFECDLSPNISFHRDLHESVKRGDLNGCSFAFQVDEDDWSDTGGAYPVRTIRSVKALSDVSVVADPAYPHTEVGLRSDVDLAEVRSRIAKKPKLSQPRPAIVEPRWGVYTDTWKQDIEDAAVIARRRSITDFLLS